MKITILCVGSLKEKYWKMAVEEYEKRLSRYCNIEIYEVPDEKAPENMSQAQEDQVKKIEGERILKKCKDSAFVIALSIEGKSMSSEGFSSCIENKMTQGVSHIVFVIGGSLGLSDDVLKRAEEEISFSKFTFPHQLMRVIVLEQIYRGIRIMRGEPYHK